MKCITEPLSSYQRMVTQLWATLWYRIRYKTLAKLLPSQPPTFRKSTNVTAFPWISLSLFLCCCVLLLLRCRLFVDSAACWWRWPHVRKRWRAMTQTKRVSWITTAWRHKPDLAEGNTVGDEWAEVKQKCKECHVSSLTHWLLTPLRKLMGWLVGWSKYTTNVAICTATAAACIMES